MDKWKRLEHSDSDLPDLLIKAHFDSDGYTIQLTDLNRVWNESLSKRQIIRRAIKEDCSIDPSEGDDQLQILQEKLSSTVRQEAGTSISLSSTSNNALELRLTAPLPAPLPPFRWRVKLSLANNESIEREIVAPLIRQAQGLHRSIELLIAELHDKDRVISKITDRLEQSSNDLTTVFPGVSNIKTSRNKPQRDQLARHVKGLADFDEQSWRAQHETTMLEGPQPGDWAAILRDLPPARTGPEDGETTGWWQGVKLELNSGQTGSNTTSDAHSIDTKGKSKVRQEADDISLQDAEFQRQATPPRKNKATSPVVEKESPVQVEKANVEKRAASSQVSSQTLPAVNGSDEETAEEDEDDLDAPSQRRSQHSLRSQDAATTLITRTQDRVPETQLRQTTENGSESRRSRIGVIGGRELTSKSTDAPAERASAPGGRPKVGRIGGQSAKSSPPPQTSKPAKTSKKLGSLGGKAANQDRSPREKETPPPQHSPGKIGVMGGKKTRGQPQEALPGDTKIEGGVVPAASPDEAISRKSASLEEDPATKAARKREELKRQLEQQAKSGPSKKKRKF